MGAKTPSTIKQHSVGSCILKKFSFTDIDDTDTWASGMPGIVTIWNNCTDTPTTTTSGGCDVSVNSAGTFTFNTGEDNKTIDLYVLLRQ